MQMVQKSFYIDRLTYSELSRLAARQKVPTAELMRRLVREGMKKIKQDSNQTTTFLDKLGKYNLKGTPKNLVQNLDKYVWE